MLDAVAPFPFQFLGSEGLVFLLAIATSLVTELTSNTATSATFIPLIAALAKAIVESFVSTGFEGGRHLARINKLKPTNLET